MAKNVIIPQKNTGDLRTAAEDNQITDFMVAPLQSLSTFDGSLILIDGTGSYDNFTMVANLSVTFAESGHQEGNIHIVKIIADGTDTLTFVKPSAYVLTIPNSLTNGATLASGIYTLGFIFKNGEIEVIQNTKQAIAAVIPTVTSMSVENAEPNQLVWNFSEAVTGSEQGIDFEVDNVDRSITYLSGSGTTTIIFTISGAAILDSDVLTAALTSGDLAAVAAPQNSIADFTEDTVTNNITFVNTHSMIVNENEGAFSVDEDLAFIDNPLDDLPFSVEVWLKLDATSSARNFIVVFDDDNTHYVAGINSSGGLTFALFTDGSNKLQGQSPNSTITDNTSWHQIFVTYDGSKIHAGIKIYVDAVDQSLSDSGTGTYTGMPAVGNNFIFEMPRSNATGNSKYNLIRAYNLEKSQSYVTSSYNAGVPIAVDDPSTNGLVIECRFNENTDSSFGAVASQTGAPTYDTDVPS